MKLPRVVEDLVSSFEKLPGVGRKTAQRLVFYLLRVPQRDLDVFGKSVIDLKKKTNLCSRCHNLSEQELCTICSDLTRDSSTLCVVESFQDVIALELSGSYDGLYHVLNGSLSPLNNIGPEEIFMDDLFERLGKEKFSELILATSTSLEGEATLMYISEKIGKDVRESIKVTRIGRGLPTGVDLEYADDDTLSNALSGRSRF